MLVACTMLLYTAPSFLIGALVGAMFLRVRAIRYSWGGALLAMFAGALFPVGVGLLDAAPAIPILFMTLGLAYPLAAGLATSFFHLSRTDLNRLRDAISDLGLPRDLSAVVRRVVRRTRLWKSEQVALVRELAGSFADGLAAGRTSADLLAEFGDRDRATRRLRRVTLRGRPLAWRIWRRGAQAALWVLAIGASWYAFLFASFNLADSTVVVVPAFHAEEAGDVDQRAWPHYRAGLEWLEKAGVDRHWDGILSLRPGEPGWSEMAGFLGRNQGAFEKLREGAGRPHIGFDVKLRRNLQKDEEGEAESDLAWLTPKLIRVAQLLFADFRRAVDADDGIAAAADFDALLFLSRQCRQATGGWALSLTAYFDGVSHADLGGVLLERPTLFSEGRLAEWATMVDLESESASEFTARIRAVVESSLDRFYVGEGRPRERPAPEAVRRLLTWEWKSEVLRGGSGTLPLDWGWEGELRFRFGAPLLSAMVLGRRAMGETSEEFLEDVQHYLETPLGTRGPSPCATWLERVEASRFQRARLFPLQGLFRSLDWIVKGFPFRAQRRDATVVALARFFGRNGAWPQSLGELVPTFLSELPADRFDGRPIRYRLLPSGPVLYCVGPDRADDGGLPLSDPWSHFGLWGQPQTSPAPGDWRLLPAVDAELR